MPVERRLTMTNGERPYVSPVTCAKQGSTVVPVERRLATSSAVAPPFTAHCAVEQKWRRSTLQGSQGNKVMVRQAHHDIIWNGWSLTKAF